LRIAIFLDILGVKAILEVLPVKRISIPDAETYMAAIQDEISRTPKGRYFHRLHVVLQVLGGASSFETARLYGDSPRAIEYWVQRLTSNGLPGLLDKSHTGRPARLSTLELAKLRKDIRRDPRELGYDQNLWDGLLLSHHLTKNYSVSLCVRQCQRLFHQLGFSLQRPRRQASEADSIQQEAFKKTTTI
jgi:transposase